MQIKDITPYLPYYLGCEATLPYLADDEDWEDYFLESVSINGKCTVFNPRYGKSTHPANTIVLHLRPFDHFTVDDLKGWGEKLKELGYNIPEVSEAKLQSVCSLVHKNGLNAMGFDVGVDLAPHLIAYLCSRKIDVFGLIPAGLAKTKLGQIKKEEK